MVTLNFSPTLHTPRYPVLLLDTFLFLFLGSTGPPGVETNGKGFMEEEGVVAEDVGTAKLVKEDNNEAEETVEAEEEEEEEEEEETAADRTEANVEG